MVRIANVQAVFLGEIGWCDMGRRNVLDISGC